MNLTEFFTPRAIAAYWEDVAPTYTGFMGSALFPAQKKAGLDLSWLKGSKGAPVSLMPTAFDAKSTFRDRIGFEKLETEMPFFREGFRIKEKDRQELLRVQDSNDPYAAAIIARVFDDAAELLAGAEVVPERMIFQLLFPEDGDVGISIKASGMTATNVQTAIDELFTSGSEGKALIASAITAKGVDTAADADFQTMADNISAIPNDGLPDNVHTISLTADPPEGGTVSGGGFASVGMNVTVNAVAQNGYAFNSWRKKSETVSNSPNYSFLVENDIVLSGIFKKELVPLGEWEASTLPSTSPHKYIAYGAGKFVATVQTDKSAAISTDGLNWSSVQISTTASPNGWGPIVYGDGKFVTLCYDTNITNVAAYSYDGENWSLAELPERSSNYPFVGLTYGNGKFVAIANRETYCAYSYDGITWQYTQIPFAFELGASAITYGGSKFVAIDYGTGKSIYSKDGINWSASTMPTPAIWSNVAYGDGKFIAVASNIKQIASSSDGISWESYNVPQPYNSIQFGNGKFLVIKGNSEKAAYSYDGLTWNEVSMPSSSYWQDIAFGKNLFVTVSSVSGKAACVSG